MEEANKLVGAGKKHLVMGKVVEAVSVLQEACGMLAKTYGDTADECGEAFFWCGKALLDLARMENSVLGNALEGVPEEEDEEKPKDSNVESTENIDEKTRDELRVQVYDAMAEKKSEDAEKKSEDAEKKSEDAEKKSEDAEKKSEDAEKKSEDAEKKSEDAEKKSEDAEKKSEDAEKKSEDAEKKSEDAEKKSEDAEKKSEDAEKVEGKQSDKAEQDGDKEVVAAADEQEAAKEEVEKSKDNEEKSAENEDVKEKEGEESADKPEEAEDGEEDGDDAEMEGETQEEGEEDGTAEKDSDDEEEVGNLQLAWEMLEVAKVIYKRKETKDDQLMAAQAHLKLGEVSAESGNYAQALEDFQECLNLQVKNLDSDSRLLAETHYQLGLTYSLNLQYAEAIKELNSSISVIKSRLDKLHELLDKAEGPEALASERKEMEELKALLPEIQEKVEDATEGLKLTSAASEAVKDVLGEGSTSSSFPETTVQNGDSSSASNINGTSTSGHGASTAPVSDISHLVRKKRKPEESPVKEGLVKKVKQDNQTNGVKETSTDGADTDGKETNGHTNTMEVESQ